MDRGGDEMSERLAVSTILAMLALWATAALLLPGR